MTLLGTPQRINAPVHLPVISIHNCIHAIYGYLHTGRLIKGIEIPRTIISCRQCFIVIYAKKSKKTFIPIISIITHTPCTPPLISPVFIFRVWNIRNSLAHTTRVINKKHNIGTYASRTALDRVSIKLWRARQEGRSSRIRSDGGSRCWCCLRHGILLTGYAHDRGQQ